MADVSFVQLPSDECNLALPISQHWFRQWLGAIRYQAIPWANVDQDLCRHMASIGPQRVNEYFHENYIRFLAPLSFHYK